ncbi:MAG: hypothetical protein K1X82_10600 [Bacteroidia bacterium]|nr:hypothetical protein [Bacteroidia bacterium]
MKVIGVFKTVWSSFTPKDFNVLFGVWNNRVNLLFKVPHLISMGVFVKPTGVRKEYGLRKEEDVQFWVRRRGVVVGRDWYTGEFAILFSFIQAWIKLDWVSQRFFQTGQFLVFVLQIYLSSQEFRFKIGVLGIAYYIRIGKKA